MKELIVDNFAGGGGVSTGIVMATGRSVDIAINHDDNAIAMHTVNHPEAMHYCESVWDIIPEKVINGQPVALAWFSPDCKHFSRAKGGKPKSKNIRGLAWVALKWAATVKPRVIILENVEEFKTWGPLVDGKPCQKRKGQTFNAFKNALRRQGYVLDHRELVACDYGTPTIRKRFFLVARRDDKPIVWPTPTHGSPDSDDVRSGKLLAYRTAAECIDWSIPCPSIFERKKPLVKKTLERIVKGLHKFVLDNPTPFIVSYYGQKKEGEFRGQEIAQPLPTQTVCNRFGLVVPRVVAPFITEHANASNQRNMAINEPMRTLCAGVKGGHFAVVAPYVARYAFVLKYYGTNIGSACDAPVQTITTKHRFALTIIKSIKPPLSDDMLYMAWWCARFMDEHGTQSASKVLIPAPRRQWVNINDGILYDIGMRMFQPRELYTAQGFPDSYIIDHDIDGNKITKTAQVARCGNAVPPPLAAAIITANLPELCQNSDWNLFKEQSNEN